MNSIKIPENFLFSVAKANIKYKDRNDMMLIFSEKPALVSAVFTKNKVKAAPVLYSEAIMKKKNMFKGILINSGNANACTGEEGIEDCRKLAKHLSERFSLSYDEILISSTGVIGVRLPVDNMIKEFNKLKTTLSPLNYKEAAEAIMTTDTFSKIYSVSDSNYSILGIAKGAGMINPDMATMLAFVLTDAELPENYMKKTLRKIVDKTFNSICVDGDTSTNDSVFLIANGTKKNIDLNKFENNLYKVCLNLAKMIVKDGEGATKLVKITVNGGVSEKQCKNIAESLAKSLLVKTAFFGADPNWGRIICAIGYSGEDVCPDKIDIFYGALPIVKQGIECREFDEKQAAQYLKENSEIELKIELNMGTSSWEYYTCDLTYDYVKINAEYRT